jgi:hypothetical protein
MLDCEKFPCIFIYVQLPVFVLTVIIYGLSVSILNEAVSNSTITSPRFASDGVSLNGIFIGVIVLGALNLFIQIALFIYGCFNTSWSIFILVLGLINLLFNLISEALFFEFASRFTFRIKANVIARSILVILVMANLLFVALAVIFNLYRKRGEAKIKKFDAIIAPLLFLPSIVILVLNAFLIARHS